MSLSGTFAAAQEASAFFEVPAHNSATIGLESAALTGSVILEKQVKGGVEIISVFSAEDYDGFTYVYENSTDVAEYIRLRCEAIDDEENEEVAYSIVAVSGEKVELVLQEKSGKRLAYIDDLGRLVFERSFVNDSVPAHEAVSTNGDAAVVVGVGFYETKITTSGSEGAEDIELVDGVYIGQRKLVTLAVEGHADDVVSFDNGDDMFSTAGAALASLTIDAADGFVLLEWRGAWHVIALSGATETEA
jgi:hypothetical protein